MIDMAGYDGWSMSNNAREQYDNGEMPKSKWTKEQILRECRKNGFPKYQLIFLSRFPQSFLKERGLYRSSWHHTSSHYNKTDFYSVDFDALERLSASDLKHIANERKSISQNGIRTASKPKYEQYEVEWQIWGGTKKHRKIEGWNVDVGLINPEHTWYYSSDCYTKKKVSGNWFRIKRQIKRATPEEKKKLDKLRKYLANKK